jgi:alkylation response protein AidB-like acyl-CoA dehydrogenase
MTRAALAAVSADLDAIELEAPIFEQAAFGLSDRTAELADTGRRLGQGIFAARARAYDREARFPSENYDDLHRAGLLGICVPQADGGLGADYRTYAITAAEIGRYCGSTALTWNMHVCSTLWAGAIADDLDLEPDERAEHARHRSLHFRRIVEEGAIYSQPFSEGGAAAAGGSAFETRAVPTQGGWLVSGKKIFASLSGHADYYGILCTEISEGGPVSRRNTLYLAIPAKADGVSVSGDWDPLGMRGTVSRTLIFDNVFVPADASLMPRGLYFQAATRWPHMFLTLSPTYLGLAQAAYDFTVRYLRGEMPGTPPVKRRQYPTKQIAVAEMRIKLEGMKALWFQAISEARVDPTKDQVLRAWAAQYTTMETANDIARLAIRTCGGQAMLRALPLERIYRDSRCGALMLPWTADSASTASAARRSTSRARATSDGRDPGRFGSSLPLVGRGWGGVPARTRPLELTPPPRSFASLRLGPPHKGEGSGEVERP